MPQFTVEQAVQLAAEQIASRQWNAAQELYRGILTVEPNHPAALYGMGIISNQIGRLDMAIQWLDRAAAASPGAYDVHATLGEVLRRAGMLAPAIVSLQRSLAIKPDYAPAQQSFEAATKEKQQLDAGGSPEHPPEPRLPNDPRRLVVVSGFYSDGSGRAEDFFSVWYDNTIRYSKPFRIYIINGGSVPVNYGDCHWINLAENLGHMSQMQPGQQLGGWSSAVLIGCLLAYHDRADMIYKEQDCLAFGNYVERLYQDLGDKGMVTGSVNTTGEAAGLLSQSLVLTRLDFLLELVARYISLWPSDRQYLTEQKFAEISRSGRVAQTKMGYDRSRPVNYSDPAFYMQKITAEEMGNLRKAGLV